MDKVVFIAVAIILFVGTGKVAAQIQAERIEALENQIHALQSQLDLIKKGEAAPDWLEQADNRGLSLNFYGEAKWNVNSGADFGDPHRFVLIPGYRLSDFAYFNSEIELEHGGVDDSDGGRWNGELELEQFSPVSPDGSAT